MNKGWLASVRVLVSAAVVVVLGVAVAGCATAPSDRAATGSIRRLGIGVFDGDADTARSIGTVLQADLRRGGLVSVVDAQGAPLSSMQRPDWAAWSARGAGAVGGGRIVRSPGGRQRVEFRLWDLGERKELGAMQFDTDVTDMRGAGHAIADFVQLKLAGAQPMHALRRGRVAIQNGRYVLSVMDSDGENPMSALSSLQPLMLPTWTADRSELAYVSFETPQPQVFIQNLRSAMRQLAGPASSLAAACRPYAAVFSAGAGAAAALPARAMDDEWDREGGAACKAALLSLAQKDEVGLARMRLGLPPSPARVRGSQSDWSAQVGKMIRSNTVFNREGVSGNPSAEIEVRLGADGEILKATLKTSSGLPDWDSAALRGVLKTERLPLDADGRVPPVLTLLMRPFP